MIIFDAATGIAVSGLDNIQGDSSLSRSLFSAQQSYGMRFEVNNPSVIDPVELQVQQPFFSGWITVHTVLAGAPNYTLAAPFNLDPNQLQLGTQFRLVGTPLISGNRGASLEAVMTVVA